MGSIKLFANRVRMGLEFFFHEMDKQQKIWDNL